MTKTFKEVVAGIRTAIYGREVREDIAQGMEYVEEFSSTAVSKASEASSAAISASQSAASAASSKDAAAASEASASTSASSAFASATNAAASASEAKQSAGEAAASAELAGTRAGTDKTLIVEDAPADARVTGEKLAILDLDLKLRYTKEQVDALLTQYKADCMLATHPVGSLYISDDPTSPAELFGGTWEQIKDKFILAAGDTYAAGSAGGNAIHTHELDKLVAAIYPAGPYFDYKYVKSDSWESNYSNSIPSGNAPQKQKNYSNGIEVIGRPTKTSSNMPPYTAKYVWQRIE